MNKKQKIAFWILFPLTSLFISALLIFYLDLANGPLACFVVEVIVLSLAIIAEILIRNFKKRFKVLPFLAVVIANLIIIPLATPATVVKSAVRNANPEYTEVMQLVNGKVKGVYNADKSVEVYAGIPYAKAPIGDLRWKAPQDIDGWIGVRDCSKFAAREMQVDQAAVINTLVDIYAEKSWHPDYNMYPLQNMSEDCLYLNIWRPVTTETNLPILVYIHGGSLTTGSGAYEDYNGEEMAKKGVIMITIQYRLGVFGYLALDELKAEDPSTPTTGNYGLLDQIKALEWVKKNATHFNGDPNNITIAGESAGSSSVSALCCSPLVKEKQLIKRAIGESSSVVVEVAPHTFRSYEDATKVGKSVLEEFNCKNVNELRKIPAERLVHTKSTNSGMTIDGYALTKSPYQTYLDGENNEEALLNGYNVLEGDAFVIPTYLFSPTNGGNIKARLIDSFGDEYGNRIYNAYKDDIDKDAFSTMNEIFSHYWFMYPHFMWANAAKNNGVKVYSYQFTKNNNFHGTYHAGELIYAYGNVKNETRSYRYNESDLALSETMLSYWANFAKTGNPNGSGLTTWNEYDGTTLFELGDNIGHIQDKNIEKFNIYKDYSHYLTNKENSNEL